MKGFCEAIFGYTGPDISTPRYGLRQRQVNYYFLLHRVYFPFHIGQLEMPNLTPCLALSPPLTRNVLQFSCRYSKWTSPTPTRKQTD